MAQSDLAIDARTWFQACRTNDLKTVEAMSTHFYGQESGIDHSHKNYRSIHHCCATGSAAVLAYLLSLKQPQYRSELGSYTSDGLSALHIAVLRGSIECIRLLLGTSEVENSCVYNDSNNNRTTPLILAVVSNKGEQIVEMLSHVQSGRFSREGYTALMYACVFGHSHYIQYLEQEIGLARDGTGVTALMRAAESLNYECITPSLIEGEAGKIDENGETALMRLFKSSKASRHFIPFTIKDGVCSLKGEEHYIENAVRACRVLAKLYAVEGQIQTPGGNNIVYYMSIYDSPIICGASHISAALQQEQEQQAATAANNEGVEEENNDANSNLLERQKEDSQVVAICSEFLEAAKAEESFIKYILYGDNDILFEYALSLGGIDAFLNATVLALMCSYCSFRCLRKFIKAYSEKKKAQIAYDKTQRGLTSAVDVFANYFLNIDQGELNCGGPEALAKRRHYCSYDFAKLFIQSIIKKTMPKETFFLPKDEPLTPQITSDDDDVAEPAASVRFTFAMAAVRSKKNPKVLSLFSSDFGKSNEANRNALMYAIELRNYPAFEYLTSTKDTKAETPMTLTQYICYNELPLKQVEEGLRELDQEASSIDQKMLGKALLIDGGRFNESYGTNALQLAAQKNRYDLLPVFKSVAEENPRAPCAQEIQNATYRKIAFSGNEEFQGFTPLMIAIMIRANECIEFFCKNGWFVGARLGAHDLTALMELCRYGGESAIVIDNPDGTKTKGLGDAALQAIINAEAGITLEKKKGFPEGTCALHILGMIADPEIEVCKMISHLLPKEAFIERKDKKGITTTPLQVLVATGREDVLTMLREKGYINANNEIVAAPTGQDVNQDVHVDQNLGQVEPNAASSTAAPIQNNNANNNNLGRIEMADSEDSEDDQPLSTKPEQHAQADLGQPSQNEDVNSSDAMANINNNEDYNFF